MPPPEDTPLPSRGQSLALVRTDACLPEDGRLFS